MDELTAFAAEVKRKLADLSFASKRRVVDLLDTRVVLKMVDGKRYSDVTCKLTLDQETLPVESSSRQAPKGTTEPGIVFTPHLMGRHNPVKSVTFSAQVPVPSSSRLIAS